MGGLHHLGMRGGFTRNRQSKIIDHLARSIDNEEKRSLIAYEKFSRLERKLGDLISGVLIRHLGKEEIHAAFPEKVLENVSKGGTCDYSQAHYNDLLSIILHNWDAFSPLFATSRTQLKKTLERINYGLRRYLAHPHKASRHGYQFRRDDVAAVETGLALIESAQIRLSSIGGT
jgi:hypothetical protein